MVDMALVVINNINVLPKQHLRRRVSIPPLRSININVIPSFGHIVNVNDNDRRNIVRPYLPRSARFKAGEAGKELFTVSQETSTLPDMPHSVLRRLLRSLLPSSTSMTMLRDPVSAEDSVSDRSTFLFNHSYPYLKAKRQTHQVYFISFSRKIYWSPLRRCLM